MSVTNLSLNLNLYNMQTLRARTAAISSKTVHQLLLMLAAARESLPVEDVARWLPGKEVTASFRV